MPGTYLPCETVLYFLHHLHIFNSSVTTPEYNILNEILSVLYKYSRIG